LIYRQTNIENYSFLKFQDDGHIGMWANGIKHFLTCYSTQFPKIYNFRNPQENPTKIHKETDY